jgi:hypothetical protein
MKTVMEILTADKELENVVIKANDTYLVMTDDMSRLTVNLYDYILIKAGRKNLSYNEYDGSHIEERLAKGLSQESLAQVVKRTFIAQKNKYKSFVSGMGAFYSKYPNAL